MEATSSTLANLPNKDEGLTSLKKLDSTSSIVLFSLLAVSLRNICEPSDNVEPGTTVLTVTFVPLVSFANPLEKTLTDALETL